jgi:hypothetical protein
MSQINQIRAALTTAPHGLYLREVVNDTGIRMSYIQIFNYLIHFYLRHSAEPRTKWASGAMK